MSVYKLSGTVANSNAIAQFDIRTDGMIYAVSITIRPTALDALSDYSQVEVGFGSVSTIGINDSLQSIFTHCVVQCFLTSGGGIGSCTAVSPALKVPVFAGERIYLHDRSVGGGGIAESLIYVEDGVELKAARRRR